MSSPRNLEQPLPDDRLNETIRDGNVEQLESKDEDIRGDHPTIGMYHRTAGTRTASGITTYVRELVDRLAASGPAYLYTESGELTRTLRRSDATVVQVDRAGNGTMGELVGAVPTPDVDALTVFRRALPTLVGAYREGTLRHMNENLDVLVTHDWLDDIVLSNLLDVPVVRIFHGFERTGIGTAAHELLSSGYSLVNSVRTEAEFAEHLGYRPDGIVYPGVDVEAFTPDEPPAFDRDEPTILFAGRLVESKGVFDLVDAFAGIRERAHLHVVGRGDREAVRDRVARHGLERSVTVQEAVPHEDLARYFTAADVVCTPSHYESFGMVNLEAMACGTPVVTTNVPGITEYAIDGETAMLVPPNDPDALAESLAEVVAEPELRRRLSERGRERARRYSWGNSSETLLERCGEIVARHDERRS